VPSAACERRIQPRAEAVLRLRGGASAAPAGSDGDCGGEGREGCDQSWNCQVGLGFLAPTRDYVTGMPPRGPADASPLSGWSFAPEQEPLGTVVKAAGIRRRPIEVGQSRQDQSSPLVAL